MSALPESSGELQNPLVEAKGIATAKYPANGQPLCEQIFDSLDTSWTCRFQHVYHGNVRHLILRRELPRIRNLEDAIRRHDSIEELGKIWESFDPGPEYSKAEIWDDTMLWCMSEFPKRALKLLLATQTGPSWQFQRYKFADCLQYLVRNFLQGENVPDPWTLWALQHATYEYMKRREGEPPGSFPLPDNVAYLLLKKGDGRALLDALMDSPASLHSNTLLHFLQSAVDWGLIPAALRILRAVIRSRCNTDQPAIQAACVKLVRARFPADIRYRARIQIATQVLETGIRPRTPFYNMMLLNAIEAEEYDTAWSMYRMAVHNNLPRDPATYGIMLKGAALKGDPKFFQQVMNEVRPRKFAIRSDPRFLGDILNTVSRQMSSLRQAAFPQMFRLYREYCDLKPLLELGICESGNTSQLRRNDVHPNPTPHVLSQIICAYVSMEKDLDKLLEVYQRYHDQVVLRHPVIAPTAQWDFVANCFILAFGRKPENLRHCAAVVRHMLEAMSQTNQAVLSATSVLSRVPFSPPLTESESPPPSSFSPSFPKISREAAHRSPARENLAEASWTTSPPTVRTWSLLASAYFRHKQKSAAERVHKLMRARGLKPDAASWNSIIDGYSGLQDIEAAVSSVKQMRAESYEVDSSTVRSLSKIWDRERLLDALERASKSEITRKGIDSIKGVGSISLSGIAEGIKKSQLHLDQQEQLEGLFGDKSSKGINSDLT